MLSATSLACTALVCTIVVAADAASRAAAAAAVGPGRGITSGVSVVEAAASPSAWSMIVSDLRLLLSGHHGLQLLYLAIGVSAVASWLQAWGQAQVRPHEAVVVYTMDPVCTPAANPRPRLLSTAVTPARPRPVALGCYLDAAGCPSLHTHSCRARGAVCTTHACRHKASLALGTRCVNYGCAMTRPHHPRAPRPDILYPHGFAQVYATFFAYLLLGETFGLRGWTGIALVLAANVLRQVPTSRPALGHAAPHCRALARIETLLLPNHHVRILPLWQVPWESYAPTRGLVTPHETPTPADELLARWGLKGGAARGLKVASTARADGKTVPLLAGKTESA